MQLMLPIFLKKLKKKSMNAIDDWKTKSEKETLCKNNKSTNKFFFCQTF